MTTSDYTDQYRDKAEQAARVRVTAFGRKYGVYTVTVGGYVAGKVEKDADFGTWTAYDDEHKPIWVPAATLGTTAVFHTRRAAARAVARTDHAALCYRDAALEGTFGFPEQTAAQAELDRQLGNLPY